LTPVLLLVIEYYFSNARYLYLSTNFQYSFLIQVGPPCLKTHATHSIKQVAIPSIKYMSQLFIAHGNFRNSALFMGLLGYINV